MLHRSLVEIPADLRALRVEVIVARDGDVQAVAKRVLQRPRASTLGHERQGALQRQMHKLVLGRGGAVGAARRNSGAIAIRAMFAFGRGWQVRAAHERKHDQRTVRWSDQKIE